MPVTPLFRDPSKNFVSTFCIPSQRLKFQTSEPKMGNTGSSYDTLCTLIMFSRLLVVAKKSKPRHIRIGP